MKKWKPKIKIKKKILVLSKSDKKRLTEIRKQKHKLVLQRKYEEASILRQEERNILGLGEVKVISSSLDFKFEVTEKDIKKVHKMIEKSIKTFNNE